MFANFLARRKPRRSFSSFPLPMSACRRSCLLVFRAGSLVNAKYVFFSSKSILSFHSCCLTVCSSFKGYRDSVFVLLLFAVVKQTTTSTKSIFVFIHHFRPVMKYGQAVTLACSAPNGARSTRFYFSSFSNVFDMFHCFHPAHSSTWP